MSMYEYVYIYIYIFVQPSWATTWIPQFNPPWRSTAKLSRNTWGKGHLAGKRRPRSAPPPVEIEFPKNFHEIPSNPHWCKLVQLQSNHDTMILLRSMVWFYPSSLCRWLQVPMGSGSSMSVQTKQGWLAIQYPPMGVASLQIKRLIRLTVTGALCFWAGNLHSESLRQHISFHFKQAGKKEVLLPAGQALLGSWHESENPTGQGPTISANCASHAQLQGPVSDVKSFCQKRFQSSGSLLSSKAASRANNKVVERLFPRPRNCQFKPFYPWQLYKYKIIKVYKSTMSELLWN